MLQSANIHLLLILLKITSTWWGGEGFKTNQASIHHWKVWLCSNPEACRILTLGRLGLGIDIFSGSKMGSHFRELMGYCWFHRWMLHYDTAIVIIIITGNCLTHWKEKEKKKKLELTMIKCNLRSTRSYQWRYHSAVRAQPLRGQQSLLHRDAGSYRRRFSFPEIQPSSSATWSPLIQWHATLLAWSTSLKFKHHSICPDMFFYPLQITRLTGAFTHIMQ